MAEHPPPPPGVDITKPSQARVWDFLLGGENFYEVDLRYAERLIAANPNVRDVPRQSRGFMRRAVTYVAEQGVRQFLDVGAGLPTHPSVHEIAQAVTPESRVVYVDYDPAVLVHATAMLTGAPPGACDYVQADAREPDVVLRGAAGTLDLNSPIALVILGVMGTIDDDRQAYALTRRYMDALAPGSYLILGDGSRMVDPDWGERVERIREQEGGYAYRMRTVQQIAGFFEGLDLLEPGVVSVSRWRPEPHAQGAVPEVNGHGGVGRKPQTRTPPFSPLLLVAPIRKRPANFRSTRRHTP